jgi:hypothetical protein
MIRLTGRVRETGLLEGHGTPGVGVLGFGKHRLVYIHLMPQETVETMKERVRWINAPVGAHGTLKRSRQQ